MKKPELKQCPFCGGEAQLIKRNVYLDYGYKVECVRCYAKSHIVLVDHPIITYKGLNESTRYTDEQARQKAAERWNRRQNN